MKRDLKSFSGCLRLYFLNNEGLVKQMKIEVKTKENEFINLEGVKTVLNLDEGYYFQNEEEKTLLFVPHSNLAYYRQV